jgi:hypothetical protein
MKWIKFSDRVPEITPKLLMRTVDKKEVLNPNLVFKVRGNCIEFTNESNLGFMYLHACEWLDENYRTGLTRKDFENQLKKIGWSIQKSGNGLNDKLITHNGKETGMRVNHDSLTIFSDSQFFGESFVGLVTFRFENMEIIEGDTICIGGSILLMNHDKK